MSTLHNVVEEEQQNGGPKENRPLTENENPASKSKKYQGMELAIKRRK